jgi:hypothetical protein
MNLHRRLAVVLILLALVGCVRVATGPGQEPYAPYSPGNSGNTSDRTGDGSGGGEM